MAGDHALPHALHNQLAGADLRHDFGNAHAQALDTGRTQLQRVFGRNKVAVKAAVVNDLLPGKPGRAQVINPKRTGAVPLNLLFGRKVQAILGDGGNLAAGQSQQVFGLEHPFQKGLCRLIRLGGSGMRNAHPRSGQ